MTSTNTTDRARLAEDDYFRRKDAERIADAVGEDMHRTFTAIKAAEHARVMRTVSEVDFDLYLHTV